METHNTQTVVAVTPSIPMKEGTIKRMNKWFNENLDIVYEEIIKPKIEQEKRKGA